MNTISSKTIVQQYLDDALSSLRAYKKPDDLKKTVVIRGEKHTIVQAINRQLTHYSYHVGQIVFLAKHFRSREWKSLTIPRNRSSEFNSFLATQAGGVADREKQFEAGAEFSDKV